MSSAIVAEPPQRGAGERAVQLLGTVPFFDFDTGADIVSLLSDQIDEQQRMQWANDFLLELAGVGLIEPVRDLHRIPESFRDKVSGVAVAFDADVVAQAINIFIERAETSMKKSLSAVLGLRGRKITVQTLKVVSNPDDNARFDELVETLHRSSRLGRHQDSRSAASLLRSYNRVEDRRIVFLEALGYWQGGDRAEASLLFQRVLDYKIKDKADAIAAHLVGVHDHEVGKSDDSIPLFTRSERTLSRIPDYRGLTITRTSHARVLRDIARRDSSEEGYRSSIKKFVDARASLNKAPSNRDEGDRAQSLGRIDLGEGQAWFALGEQEKGIELVKRALRELKGAPEQELWTRIVLAGMYRDMDEPIRAREALAPFIAKIDAGEPTWQLAQALNVLASIERHTPETRHAALSKAIRSVEIGYAIGNNKHVGHALLTQANIEIDMLETAPSITQAETRQVRAHLHKAKSMLGGDARSLDMISDAFRRLDAVSINAKTP